MLSESPQAAAAPVSAADNCAMEAQGKREDGETREDKRFLLSKKGGYYQTLHLRI